MRVTTLGDMLRKAAFAADVPTFTATTAITLQNATDVVNDGIAELFNIVIDAVGDAAYRKTIQFTTGLNQTIYPLPADLYQLTDLELIFSPSTNSDRVILKTFTIAERPWLLSATPGWSGEPFRYRRQGKTTAGSGDTGSLELLPMPTYNCIIEMSYIYGPPVLVNAGDTFDGFANFDDYAVQFSACRFARFGEDYEKADRLAAEAERVKQNVLQGMKKLDAMNPPRVNMTRDPSGLSRRFNRYGWSRW